MSEKDELLKTLGFSDELLKYFHEHPIENQVAIENEFENQTIESHDLTDVPNFDQIEIAGTTFTFSSIE